MGHFYSNWKKPGFRKLILNAIVWTAGAKVPPKGVEASFYSDREVTKFLYGKNRKGLILTGQNHPAHDWEATTPIIQKALKLDTQLHVDISTHIEDLHQYDLSDYDFLVINYCNWETPKGLSKYAKKAFVDYLNNGGGLLLIHFANGAFHPSLPGAETSDWPEYRKICRRVWDHTANSGHDKYGQFQVNITPLPHPITEGLKPFMTTDELYYNQQGEAPIQPLLTAYSKDTGKEEPLAWTYSYGKGKVFQILLGHDVKSLQTPEVQEILKRAGIWVTPK